MAHSDSHEEDIRAALERYVDAFGEGDFLVTARSMAFPVMLIANDWTQLFQTADDYAQAMTQMSAELAARGYATSRFIEVVVTLLDTRLAIAATRFERLRDDGSVLEIGAALYTVRQQADGWKIAVMAPATTDIASALRR